MFSFNVEKHVSLLNLEEDNNMRNSKIVLHLKESIFISYLANFRIYLKAYVYKIKYVFKNTRNHSLEGNNHLVKYIICMKNFLLSFILLFLLLYYLIILACMRKNVFQ